LEDALGKAVKILQRANTPKEPVARYAENPDFSKPSECHAPVDGRGYITDARRDSAVKMGFRCSY